MARSDTPWEREECHASLFLSRQGCAQELSRDELGLDFPDVETAYRETFCAARDIMAVFAACGRIRGLHH